MFYGEFKHSLDAKGRLILPAIHREFLTEGGFVTVGMEGCLNAYRVEDFEERKLEMLEKARRGPEERNAMRFWAGKAARFEPDKQGRIVLPANLRAWAELGNEVMVVGTINHVEIWNLERWQPVETQGGHHLLRGDQALADMAF